MQEPPAKQPPVISRQDWGADESLRFAQGRERAPARFWPVQKLFVHHTAGRNGEPDPRATLRWLQRFHVLERGFGDIGYNLLIDEGGCVYEGRHSPFAQSGEAPPAHDAKGRAVAATHVLGCNAGSISVALLGHFVEQEPSDAATDSLVAVIAWLAGIHRLDPLGSGPYLNPVTGEGRHCAHVAGHGEIAATMCPGERLSARLRRVRAEAAEMLGLGAGPC